jgi:3-phenylpropionate/trans-cinnamate dioxygenase ferredoxin reductase subunit
MTDTVVIVGAGHVAGQAVASLRQGGFAGRLVLVGEEPYLPYQRPPLSKKFLAGELDMERLFLRHEHFYPEHGVELRLGTRAERIDRQRRQVHLSGGDRLEYDRLLLAIGSQARYLHAPGADLPGIFYLRNIEDVRRIQKRWAPGKRMVVIGGGYIGLEVAAVAVTHGLKVTVIEIADRLMARTVAPAVSEFYEDAHRKAGVDVRCNTAVTEFRAAGEGLTVICDGHTELPADLVIAGIGILPNTLLADEGGLACENGILVDEHCRTSDPRVFAAGDCTNHPNSLLGRRLRLESVQNAQEQAKTAAAAICGNPVPYAQIPWFWSDQYDLKLQIVGLATDYSAAVVRGNPAERSFMVFYFDGDRLMAVDAVNSPREFMMSKKLVAQGARLAPDDVADVRIDFKTLAGHRGPG